MIRVPVPRIWDVLVVGAGPAGLVAAITLARYGIDVLVIDRREEPSGLSRSLVISTGGMELMRRFGLEDAVRAGAADVKIRAWVTSDLASPEGSEMALGYPSDAEAASVSPTRPAWVPQDHHEPILVEHLGTLPTATVRFGCDFLEARQNTHGVRATVIDIETKVTEQLQARYLIAADGARSSVRDQLGIRMVGPDDLADYERVEFTAPLWDLIGERRYGLYVITRPDVAGVLTPRGRGDRWGLSRETPIGTPGLLELDHAQLVDLIRSAAGSDVIRPEIERVNSFTFAAQLAERYRQGRCFLVGDAAHRMTPRGGTGMNTAIQDSFDLGWKLAWVLQGWAGPALLESYERDRRPIGAHNVERAGAPGGAHQEADEALPWDLGARLPHHWLATGDGQRSTVDLIGDGLTLLAGPADPRWVGFAESNTSKAPITVHVVDADTAEALDLPVNGALLTRPDGHELRRWADYDSAATPAVSNRIDRTRSLDGPFSAALLRD